MNALTGYKKNLLVYELTQPYIMERQQNGAIRKVTIQRISQNEWLPIISMEVAGNHEVNCVIKTMAGSQRRWHDLNKLCQWIRNELKIYNVDLALNDVQLVYRGGKR